MQTTLLWPLLFAFSALLLVACGGSEATARIAFVSDRDDNSEIYIMDADGSNLTNLTNNPAVDGFHAWSPDSNKIAFVSDRDDNSEIYVMDADGSNLTRLTNNPAEDTLAAWSHGADP